MLSSVRIWERIREGERKKERNCANRQKKDKAGDDKKRKDNLFCT